MISFIGKLSNTNFIRKIYLLNNMYSKQFNINISNNAILFKSFPLVVQELELCTIKLIEIIYFYKEHVFKKCVQTVQYEY